MQVGPACKPVPGWIDGEGESAYGERNSGGAAGANTAQLASDAVEMAMEAARPTVEFDHHAPEFIDDPVRPYAEVRGKCPVAWTESHGGHWVTTRYEDIARIARDDATFSSARRSEDSGLGVVVPEGK